ncbi:MAG: hypothetical protein ACOY3Y_06445, partial [Acidobacteriota bacterium]
DALVVGGRAAGGMGWAVRQSASEGLGQQLAEVAAREEDPAKRKKARWYLHSRLALAVVRIARTP